MPPAEGAQADDANCDRGSSPCGHWGANPLGREWITQWPRVRAKLWSRSRSACIYGYNLMQERRTHLASLLDTQIVLPDVI